MTVAVETRILEYRDGLTVRVQITADLDSKHLSGMVRRAARSKRHISRAVGGALSVRVLEVLSPAGSAQR